MPQTLKKNLRAKIKQIRSDMSHINRHSANLKIQEKITRLPEFKQAQNILFYVNLPQEVATLEILEKFIHEKNIILPRMEGNKLILHHVKNLQHLKKGNLKILEPITTLAVVDPSTVELAFIPGLAFDQEKNRLGYGKGFYDQLLPALKCLQIGLAYECQIVEDIPREAHDHPLNMIITENRIIV